MSLHGLEPGFVGFMQYSDMDIDKDWLRAPTRGCTLVPSVNYRNLGTAMSPVRELYNPAITKLLREHDQLPHDKVEERKSFQRRILFLMNTIKYAEFEESFA